MKKILFLSLVLAFVSACNNDRFTGEGPIVEREIDLSTFDKINLDAGFDIEISQGNTQKVVAIGQDNIIDRLSTTISNDELLADLLPGNYSDFTLKLQITVSDLEKVTINGSGDIEIANLSVDNLEIKVDGSGNILASQTVNVSDKLVLDSDGSGDLTFNTLNADDVEISMDGSGDLNFSGEGDKIDIALKSSGQLSAFNFTTTDCTVVSDGSGDTEVNVSDNLDVNIAGSGDVIYRGNPEIVSVETGSGELVDGN